MDKAYDVIVIGAGPGGSSCAEMLNKAGLRVALVEKNALGGECLNYGCDPTKTMLYIAKLLTHAKQAQRFGAKVTSAAVDWDALQARITEVQQEMRGGTREEAVVAMRERGIDLFCGVAKFTSAHSVQIDEQSIGGDQIVIATGADAVIPPIPGLDTVASLTNREVIYLDKLPARMAIVGAGPIGVEFAQMFNRFGVEIVLIEASNQLLPKDDAEVAAALADLLIAEGIDLRLNTKLTRVDGDGTGTTKRLMLAGPSDTAMVTCDALLMAVGRAPTIADLQLEAAGIQVDEGKIVVDAALRTSVAHIWSIGDVTGGYPFTHVANAQGRHVAQSILKGQNDAFNQQAVPWVTYTSPEVAHVGQTEAQLCAHKVQYRVGKFNFTELARAQATGNKAGLVKLLIGDGQTILGCHMIGEGAGELIAPAVLAMRSGLPVTTLQDIILPYPTMVEALQRAANALTS